MVDGVNFNNDLNPRTRRHSAYDSKFNPNATIPDLASTSQGMNLDSDLIDSLEVHDSSVSAKYGNFEGGVVEVNTKDPRKGFHGKISMKTTNNRWRKGFIDEKMKDIYDDRTDTSLQKKYDKFIYNLTLDGYLSENFGLIFSASQTRSSFNNINSAVGSKNVYWNSNLTPPERKLPRRSDNYLLKGIWHASDYLTIRPELIYTPAYSRHYNNFSKTGDWDLRSDGLVGKIGIDYDGDAFDFKQIFSYSQMQSSKHSDTQYYRTWPTSNVHYWGGVDANRGKAIEGAYGDINQEQKTFSYKGEFDFKDFEISSSIHDIKAGYEFAHKEGRYHIPGFYNTWREPTELGVGQSCMPGDELCVGGAGYTPLNSKYVNGAYFKEIRKYEGDAKVSMNEYGIWLQDDINLGKFNIRPGIRLDYDSHSSKTTFSPRFAANYDIFGDENSVINLGLNRYHGRNIYAYALRNAMRSLGQTCKRNGPDEELICSENTEKSKYVLSELEVPYTDELTLGFTQKIADIVEAKLKYVQRKGKDQIRVKSYFNFAFGGNVPPKYKEDMDTYYFEYDNSGKSKTDEISLQLATIKDIEILGSKNTFDFIFSYAKTEQNFNGIDEYLDRDESTYEYDFSGNKLHTDKVSYNGKIISKDDLPATTFNEPYSIKLATTTKFGALDLGFTSVKTTWSNLFTYRGKHELINFMGKTKYEGGDILAYEKLSLGRSLNWDTKFGFEFATAKNQAAFVNIDINNVLNKKVLAGRSYDRFGGAYDYYESGREFWLEVGYKW